MTVKEQYLARINYTSDYVGILTDTSDDFKMLKLRYERNEELERTDKYMLVDHKVDGVARKALSLYRQALASYRQALRDCPNKEKAEDRILPECPEICR